MPTYTYWRKNLSTALYCQFLSGLGKGTGNDEGPLSRRQDIELIGQLGHQYLAKRDMPMMAQSTLIGMRGVIGVAHPCSARHDSDQLGDSR